METAGGQSPTRRFEETEDPQTREGEVESNGIERVERAQARGGLERHRPTGAFPLGPPKRPNDPEEVRVQRKHEARPRYPRPHAAIDPVVRPHHPAQEQAGSFAGRTSSRDRKEPTSAITAGHHPARRERPRVEREQPSAKIIEGRTHGRSVGLRIALDEERLERPRSLSRLTHEMQKQRDVPSAGEAVDESVEARGVARRVEGGDESTRVGAETGEQAHEASANRGDATVGETRSDQTDDFTVLRIVEPANDADRIAFEEAPVIPAAQVLEGTEKGR